MKSKYLVRQSEVEPYAPANHTGTRNYRLIGAETVGARQVEVLVGEIERGKGALPHAHPGIEQACFFPAGAMHLFIVTSDRAKVLVIYSPPYEENPARRVSSPGA